MNYQRIFCIRLIPGVLLILGSMCFRFGLGDTIKPTFIQTIKIVKCIWKDLIKIHANMHPPIHEITI